MSRNKLTGESLATELGSTYTNFEGNTNMDADLYVVSLSDHVLFNLNKSFNFGDKYDDY